jgi:outer membrane protein
MLRFKSSLLILLLFLMTVCHAQTQVMRTLSLEEAIMLAIRESPNVKQAQLAQLSDKYSLDLAKWQFKPQYTFSAKRTTQKNYEIDTEGPTVGYVTQSATGANASASWLTPYGTKASISPSVNQNDHFHPGLTLEVIQPLLRGFGRPIVEASLQNAMDSQKISRLNIEAALRFTVTAVINAYLDVLSALKNLVVDQEALQRADVSVNQTRLFIKSGRKAGVELITVEADVANAQMRIENDKNGLDQARYALLTTIGMDPNTSIEFRSIDIPALIKKYSIPTLIESKKLTIESDFQYQADRITLEGAKKRSLLEAQDNTRWQLNLLGSVHAGDGIGSGPNAGLQSLVNGVNQTNQLTLDLKVPIGDQAAKTTLANAKIALHQATIALQQELWGKETSAINGWNSIFSAERALHFAEYAKNLQEKTYTISFQKYSHGLIDSLQLQSAQQQLITSSQALNIAQINYLKALVNLDQMIGRTLKTWKVEVCYGGEEI